MDKIQSLVDPFDRKKLSVSIGPKNGVHFDDPEIIMSSRLRNPKKKEQL